MKNKVWENPQIIALNAKETREDVNTLEGDKGLIFPCPVCGKTGHYHWNCPEKDNNQCPTKS